jgi:hypothetical protein
MKNRILAKGGNHRLLFIEKREPRETREKPSINRLDD